MTQNPYHYLQVVDILMKLVRSTFDNQVIGKADMSAAFLDSRFAALLCRKHPNFKKKKTKAAFLFSNSLVEAVRNSSASFTPATRFYLLFNITKIYMYLTVQPISCAISGYI